MPITGTYNNFWRVINITFSSYQDDAVLVDTPGIGGSGEVTEKLMEYLPNAVSFIFVINVGSAGGMQNDRVCIDIFLLQGP